MLLAPTADSSVNVGDNVNTNVGGNANVSAGANFNANTMGNVDLGADIDFGSRTAPPEKPRPKDPFIGLYFWIEIDGVNVAGFSECSPVTVETEVFEYAEGGLNLYTHKLPVRTKYGNITLKRGIDAGQDLYAWYMTTANGNIQRKNITISLYAADGGAALRSYHLYNAFPVKWTGPDLKTDAGAVTIETLEFAHDGLIFLR